MQTLHMMYNILHRRFTQATIVCTQGVTLMEHQVTVDTGEINTSPVNEQMPLHQDDLEGSSVISTFSVSNQSKTQKEPFPRDWPRMRTYGDPLVGGFAVVPSVAGAISVGI